MLDASLEQFFKLLAFVLERLLLDVFGFLLCLNARFLFFLLLFTLYALFL